MHFNGLLLGLPANEIVIPIAVMSYLGMGGPGRAAESGCPPGRADGQRLDLADGAKRHAADPDAFSCGTTLLTIRKETRSWKWTLVAFLVPTAAGAAACLLSAAAARLLGLV